MEGERFMRLSISILGITFLLLTLFFGCGKPEEPAKTPKTAATPQAAPAQPGTSKHEPLAQEHGKEGTSKLQVYDEPSMAIRAEYPDTMEAQGTGSAEGSGFIFTFKPRGNALDKAKVHIFLPRGASTAAAQEPFVTGPGGLFENNGWKKQDENETTNAAKFPYKWVRKVISFTDPGNRGMVGKILLGEAHGQAVEVILYYPADMDAKFLTNAKLILGNLQFKSDKLPLRKSR
jgi:hypothetical protein